MEMEIKNYKKLLQLRRDLQQIGEIQFGFFNINKRLPLSSITTNDQTTELVETYEEYLEQIRQIVNENEGTKHDQNKK